MKSTIGIGIIKNVTPKLNNLANFEYIFYSQANNTV